MIWELDQRGLQLNDTTSRRANQIGNQKIISITRRSRNPISRKIHTREPAVIQMFVPLLNLADSINAVQ